MLMMAASFSGEEKTCMSLGIILYKSSVLIESANSTAPK